MFLNLQPMDILEAVYENLDAAKMATVESAKSFLALLKAFRNTGKGTIEDVFTSPLSGGIV